MSKITYIKKSFGDAATDVIYLANVACQEYRDQGLDLTLRQLYYIFVAEDWFPADRAYSWTGKKWVKDPAGTKNADPNYKWLGGIINDARLAGWLDWDYIVDRTRNIRSNSHWETARSLVKQSVRWFQVEKWSDQPIYVEVWIEKDALVGVMESCCPDLDVPFFSCRGYTSQSEMWGAAQRIGLAVANGKKARVIHLGDHDHDPSGIDMTRDIEQRLALFIAQDVHDSTTGKPYMPVQGATILWDENQDYVEMLDDLFSVDRIALNMDQIRRYAPPPNPAKLNDSRAKDYVDNYGYESWELDALKPDVLVSLVREAVAGYRDDDRYDVRKVHESTEREMLVSIHDRWDDVQEFLS